MKLFILVLQFQVLHLRGFNCHVQVLLAKLQYIHRKINGQRQAHRPRRPGGESITGISKTPKKSNATSLALGGLPQEGMVL